MVLNFTLSFGKHCDLIIQMGMVLRRIHTEINFIKLNWVTA